MYILKKGFANFTCMDGPLKGHKFVHGRAYSQVPSHEAHRFDMDEGVILPLGEEIPVEKAERLRPAKKVWKKFTGLFKPPFAE